MQWTEVSVTTTNEAVEAVSNILMDAGASGTKIDDAADFAALQPEFPGELLDKRDLPHLIHGAVVTAYYPETIELSTIIPIIEQRINELDSFGLDAGPATVLQKPVAEADWATVWKKYYHPVRVTRYLTVVPSWEHYQPADKNEKTLILDPGMAFGTGTHPTTALMLQALELTIRGGETVLDVGTGSGVLSIAAKQLGAGEVFAYDVDQIAVDSAKSNLDLNPVAKDVHVSPNDLLKGVTQTADIIVANILADIIVPLIPQTWPLLPKGGLFLTSGIIADKYPLVVGKLRENGYQVVETLRRGDWYGIIAKKPEADD
ncbi:50S ribosomal protein L11 methyltransferase [Furfurilactobacillus milii]|uniref:Ribosomal protein L11 methyltransferase n=1 Tax=Furfurilactobacillus milii TaxID=2888272 RepID=A0A6N9I0X0_9LACO|nr:50S ribosomal protein L11 methyltransferase [Furfurilactobacillus milii]